MTKVLMVGPESSGKGGISTVIRNFIHYFPQKQDWQMQYIFSWKEQSKLRYAMRAFRRVLIDTREQEEAIVHFHVSQDASFYRKALLLKATKKGTKTIFHMHAPNFDQFYEQSSVSKRRYIRQILNKVDLIVALGEEWGEYYQKLTRTKVIVINNAVFVPQKNCYNAQSTNVLTFGRICERKGSQDILTLAKRIQNDLPDIRFHLYGDTDETTPKIIGKMKQLGCNNVVIHGWTTNQEELLTDCSLHLLPSYHEGIPMAILETMASGIPNLATDVGGVGQVVKDQKNGFLVTPGDVDQMEEAIRSFFASSEKRQQLSTNAKKMIEDHFSITAYLQAWEHVYESLSG